MTNHAIHAERMADRAQMWSLGHHSDAPDAAGTATALATEGVVHALLAIATELRDLRGDLAIDQPPLTVYRAASEGIGIGCYTNRDAAREHCVADARDIGFTDLAWITDADSDEDELQSGDHGRTGYTVCPVTVEDVFVDEDQDDDDIEQLARPAASDCCPDCSVPRAGGRILHANSCLPS